MTEQPHIRNEKSGPWSFYTGLALGLALIVALLAAAAAADSDYYGAVRDEVLLEKFAAQARPDGPTLILFGNSRTRQAADFGFEPARPVDLGGGKKLWSLQFAHNGAIFKEYRPLWPALLRLKPDYIVVQDALLSAMRPPGAKPHSMSVISGMLFEYAKNKILNRSPQDYWQERRNDIFRNCVGASTRGDVQAQITGMVGRERHDVSEVNINHTEAVEAVRQALAANIKVVILTLPPNLAVFDRFGVPYHKSDYYGLGHVPTHEELLPGLHDKVAWLELPVPPPEEFCDMVHVNAAGRRHFTAWFLKQF